MSKISNKWEKICIGENENGKIYDCRRMRIPGGWIFESFSDTWKVISTCFIPDAEHKWKVK